MLWSLTQFFSCSTEVDISTDGDGWCYTESCGPRLNPQHVRKNIGERVNVGLHWDSLQATARLKRCNPSLDIALPFDLASCRTAGLLLFRSFHFHVCRRASCTTAQLYQALNMTTWPAFRPRSAFHEAWNTTNSFFVRTTSGRLGNELSYRCPK